MRTYLILKERSRPSTPIRKSKDSRRSGSVNARGGRHLPADGARELKGRAFDLEPMRQQGYAYERLDQLTMELLLGVR